MPSASSTVIVTAGCSLLAYGAFLLSTSSPSQKQQSQTQTLLTDIDDIDDNNNINEEDCITPDDVVTIFDKLFMTMQQVVLQLSQQVQQIQMTGQVIPEKQLRELLKSEFQRALTSCQAQIFEENDVDADCLEEATWEFMDKPDEYPKVKRAVERFQKLYESISGEDSVVGWNPSKKGNAKSGRVSTTKKDLSPEELMKAATIYFDAITEKMVELATSWKAAGKDLSNPEVMKQFQLEASTDANEAGEDKLLKELNITMSDFRSAIDKHSRIPSVGQTLGMLQLKQQQELMSAGVPMM